MGLNCFFLNVGCVLTINNNLDGEVKNLGR